MSTFVARATITKISGIISSHIYHQLRTIPCQPEFLPLILGSYLCLYIWEKINTFFIIHAFGQIKAIFRLGMPPVKGCKTGQIKSLPTQTENDKMKAVN